MTTVFSNTMKRSTKSNADTTNENKKEKSISAANNQKDSDAINIKAAAKFSPIGKFPDNFEYWFKLEDTPHHGGRGSKGVVSIGDLEDNLCVGILDSTDHRKGQFPCLTKEEAMNSMYNPNTDKTVVATSLQTSTWVRYVNHPNSNEAANCQVFNYGDTLALVTTRPIKKDEQLLADYGEFFSLGLKGEKGGK